jgi:acyl carrier protein
LKQAIESFIVTELLHNRVSRLDADKSLISGGILDSLTLLQLIAFLEERFHIKVDDADMHPGNFQTINAATAFVERKLGQV